MKKTPEKNNPRLNFHDPLKSHVLVTILGSGTCVPSLERSSCAVLLEIQGIKLLFDIGPGTTRRLLEAGADIFDISYIFLSHFHPDHSGELAPFLFSNKYPDIGSRKNRLTIIGGNGLFNFYSRLKSVYGHWIELSPEILTFVELDNGGFDHRRYNRFTVESMPVKHNDESVAYRITDSFGVSVVYSGDTGYCDNLVKLAKGADILICESSFPDNLKVNGHLTPSLAGKIASRAKVRQLVLTHFYPECHQVDIKNECRKTYAGPLLLAEDLMQIKPITSDGFPRAYI